MPSYTNCFLTFFKWGQGGQIQVNSGSTAFWNYTFGAGGHPLSINMILQIKTRRSTTWWQLSLQPSVIVSSRRLRFQNNWTITIQTILQKILHLLDWNGEFKQSKVKICIDFQSRNWDWSLPVFWKLSYFPNIQGGTGGLHVRDGLGNLGILIVFSFIFQTRHGVGIPTLF